MVSTFKFFVDIPERVRYAKKIYRSLSEVTMTDKNLDRVNRPRDSGIYVSRVEKEKKEREKFSTSPAGADKKILMATFFSYLRKMFDSFSPSKNLAGKVVDVQKMIENLELLKEHFHKLTSQNLSKSSEFASSLSDVWTTILDDLEQFEVLERKNLEELYSLRKLIDEIKNYPPETDHRFGFYLLQHAGKDWLPFPFIEILEKLHNDHALDSKKSTLSHWILMIDTVIGNMKGKLPFKLS